MALILAGTSRNGFILYAYGIHKKKRKDVTQYTRRTAFNTQGSRHILFAASLALATGCAAATDGNWSLLFAASPVDDALFNCEAGWGGGLLLTGSDHCTRGIMTYRGR